MAASSLDFRAQNSSSCSKIEKYSSISYFWKRIRNSLGLLANAFWAPPILASTLLFLANKFSNTSWFHFLAFMVKFEMATEREIFLSQASLTTLGKLGWVIYIVWKRKGLLNWFGLGLLNSIRTGWWFEKVLGKWVTTASGYRILHKELAKHLSILSRIRSVICLLLDHVNLGPTKPKSTNLHASRHALKSMALLRFIWLPPNLSSPHRISIKSPTISQGRLCNWLTSIIIY